MELSCITPLDCSVQHCTIFLDFIFFLGSDLNLQSHSLWSLPFVVYLCSLRSVWQEPLSQNIDYLKGILSPWCSTFAQ